MNKQIKADMGLLFVTVGWGASFILTKVAINDIPTYDFLGIRFLIAFAISSIIFMKQMVKIDKKTVKYGVILGAILYFTYAFQTVGLQYTTVSKSAFITGFYVVLVPIVAALVVKVRPDRKSYISVALAFIGLALLTLNNSISGVNIGDVYTFFCAIINSFYIVYVGKYTVDVESVPFAIIQIGVVGVLSMLTSFVIEKPTLPSSYNVWGAILILSVVCTSLAYIIQNVAQKFTSATHTALIYTAEPVFAGIFSYIIYGERLGIKGILGAILILAAMLISEIDFKIFFKKKAIEESI